MSDAAISLAPSPQLDHDVRRWRNRFLVAGIAAMAIWGAGAVFSPVQFFRSYIWSYTFYLGLALGCLALGMLQFLTGGAWGVIIRRLCESASRTLPLLALLFIPLALGIPDLYSWSHANVVAADPALQQKHIYLNVPFFLARAAIYFSGWLLLTYLLNRWSLEEDRTGGGRAHKRLQYMSGPGLVFYCFSVTFMAVDWIISLNPHWFSTIFGMIFIIGQALSALAFLITMVVLLSNYRPFSEVITSRHLHDLGKLLLAFVMVWAYFSFSQFLIIWAGNLAEEIPWYVQRLKGGWQYVGLGLVFFHFALPFALLLSRDLKRSAPLLTGIALFILLMRYVDVYWLIAPDFNHGGFTLNWMDIIGPVGLGCIWLAYFAWQLTKRPLLPVGDPQLEEALVHGH